MPTKRATQAAQAVPFDSLEDMASHLQNSQQEMSNHEFQILMVKQMMKIEKSLEGLNPVKDELANHDKRLEALENKVGAQNEFPVPHTIVIQNLRPSNEVDDETLAKKVIETMHLDDVGSEDVTRVQRKGFKLGGAHQRGRAGTLLVELSSKDAKQKVLRSKKMLAQHQSEDMKMIRIDSMKTQDQLNQEHFNRTMLKMIPGGDQYYISGSGALRPQTRPASAPRPPPRSYAGAASPHQGPQGSQQWRPSQPGFQHPPPPRSQPTQQAPLLRPPVLHLADQQRQTSDYHTPDFMSR